MKLDPIQPRYLRYRSHYRIYVLGYSLLALMILSFWGVKFWSEPFKDVVSDHVFELSLSALFFLCTGSFYLFWLRSKLQKSIQVFNDHVLIHHGKLKEDVYYADIESLTIVGWSIFYIKTKSGIKHYFNSGFERIDYIWEGIYLARPDLISQEDFESYRVKLVQYDHHQKRKEWFFKHKLVDIFNWTVLPFVFMILAYIFQSQNIVIHQQGLYFFRLFMYALLVLLTTAFFYSIILKKFVFDKKVTSQMKSSEDKMRDIEFEGLILQRSKIYQLVTASFVLTMLIRMDINLYSVTKVKHDIASFKLKKGHTILIDNRYNCLGCKYQLNDGDFVVFGRGIIGQILAKEGDMVGQIAQDNQGRMIASENVQEVPHGHVAVKAANGKDIVFVRIQELIGKIQN